jgi:hypothetical protein
MKKMMINLIFIGKGDLRIIIILLVFRYFENNELINKYLPQIITVFNF